MTRTPAPMALADLRALAPRLLPRGKIGTRNPWNPCTRSKGFQG